MTEHGIKVSDVQLDLATMMSRKRKVVSDLNQGVAGLFKANGVHFISGDARLLPNREVEVSETGSKKPYVLGANHIIIATGSEVALAMGAAEQLSGKKIRVVSMPSTTAFDAQDDAYKESVLPVNVISRVVRLHHLTTLSMVAFLFLLAIVLHFTLTISRLFDRNRRLTQEVAWLRYELEQLRQSEKQ